MIRLWLVFVVLAVLVHFGISGWRNMTGRQRWNLTKSLTYSIVTALLAVLAMIAMVVLF
jgi:hypothetical protein